MDNAIKFSQAGSGRTRVSLDDHDDMPQDPRTTKRKMAPTTAAASPPNIAPDQICRRIALIIFSRCEIWPNVISSRTLVDDNARNRSAGVPYPAWWSGSERSSVLLRVEDGMGAGGWSGMIWLMKPSRTATGMIPCNRFVP